MTSPRAPISTHILDTSRGVPASGVQVVLYKRDDDDIWQPIRTSETNRDGRCADLIESGLLLTDGLYKLRFEVGAYYAAINTETLYPFVEIVFKCKADQQHYHIPLLLNPFGYSTYRGS